MEPFCKRMGPNQDPIFGRTTRTRSVQVIRSGRPRVRPITTSIPEQGEWLSTHLNIGSRLNRFIQFGSPPDNVPPIPSFTVAMSNCSLEVDGGGSTDTDGSILEHAWI